MNFLKRLFGGGEPGQPADSAGDDEGFFVYVQCDRCGDRVRLRIHKSHDLNRTDEGYTWHKTIIDNRCFRPMPTVVTFNAHYQPIKQEIEGGHYISEAEYRGAPSPNNDEN
jgi:hypothetical protein